MVKNLWLESLQVQARIYYSPVKMDIIENLHLNLYLSTH